MGFAALFWLLFRGDSADRADELLLLLLLCGEIELATVVVDEFDEAFEEMDEDELERERVFRGTNLMSSSIMASMVSKLHAGRTKEGGLATAVI